MIPEPLKSDSRKRLKNHSFHEIQEPFVSTSSEKFTPLKGKITDRRISPYYDYIKSAVEGCLEESLENVESYEREKIKSIFNKWFEDVI